MMTFAELFPDQRIVDALRQQLSWTQHARPQEYRQGPATAVTGQLESSAKDHG